MPVMQNRIYRDESDARSSPLGDFTLAACGRCDFAFNASFDPDKLFYDDSYDNSVPSETMTRHYESVADLLDQAVGLHDGFLLDIGCGKGTFLEVAAKRFPKMRGLGVDPSYVDGVVKVDRDRIDFLATRFDVNLPVPRPSAAICRHVLEHIPDPVAFMRSIATALRSHSPPVPLYVEVPDTTWIFQNGAFWDFCYEHCNYFTSTSLAEVMWRAGFCSPSRGGTLYGEQYLWGIFELGAQLSATAGDPGSRDLRSRAAAYASVESQRIATVRLRLSAARSSGRAVLIWGMATKGVLFANLVDPDRSLITHCVDINPKKRQCFTPKTGHRIEAPEDVDFQALIAPIVVVMNPVYSREVALTCESRGAVRAEFWDPEGQTIEQC